MKAAQWYGNRDVRVVDVPEPPAPPAGWVKVKVAFCGICGTDLHEYINGPQYVSATTPHPLGNGKIAPLTLGHEAAGTIVEVGPDVTNVKVGDRVSIDCCLTCDECDMCKAGQYQVCEKIGFYGLHIDGAFAEYVNFRADRMNKIPDSMSFEEATVVEPAAVSFHAVRQSKMQAGDSVIVMGCGPIGCSAILGAKAAGASVVYAVEKNPGRIELAKKCGATGVINPDNCDVLEEVKRLTGSGFDVCFETIGTPWAPAVAIETVHNRGTICMIANYMEDAPVNFIRISNTEKTIVGSLCYNNDFERVINMVKNGQMDISPLISKKIYIDDIVTKGFDELVANPGPYLKILVTPDKSLL